MYVNVVEFFTALMFCTLLNYSYFVQNFICLCQWLAITHFCNVMNAILFVFTSYQHIWPVAFFQKVV